PSPPEIFSLSLPDALPIFYPSTYEGFGLQLCEAMAAGCPVLAANRTSLPEVLGNGGQIFSLADLDELVSLLRRLTRDDSWRADRSEEHTSELQSLTNLVCR